jgi:RNA polymerase sigma factor (sigma-70 family)
MWLVESIARDLWPWRQPEEDVMQSGVMGLIRAIQGFDPAFGCELSPLARWHIKAAILKAETKEAVIYVPFGNAGLSEETARARAARSRRVKTLSPFVVDPTTARPSETEGCDVWAAMRFLPPREREIVEDVVIGDETLVDVARRLGVTKQAVFQAKKKAFGRLRKMLADYEEVA